GRVIVVRADRARRADVGDVDHADARVPAASPESVAGAQRVMQAVAAPGPARLLAAGEMLPRQPPARDFLRPRRIAEVVDDEDVADVPGYLGRDVRVALVHVEAVHTDAAGLLERDELRLRPVRHVVDLEAAAVVGRALGRLDRGDLRLAHPELAGELGVGGRPAERGAELHAQLRQLLGLAPDRRHVALAVDDHEIVDDARLVAVRLWVVEMDLRHDARCARVGNMEDRRSELPRVRNVADIGIVARDVNLAGARQLKACEARDTVRELHRAHGMNPPPFTWIDWPVI